MATIGSSTRNKKLYERGASGIDAQQRATGIVAIPSEKFDDLEGITDISQIYNDEALYQSNRILLKQIEDLRQDVEELHAFIKDFMGTSSTKGASGTFRDASKKAKTISVDKGVITSIT
tara:strand:+ start:256 stop:612 length:357 start_codon:yes stop_codon:yes gene_type:complete